jgi:hypothetical protein
MAKQQVLPLLGSSLQVSKERAEVASYFKHLIA